MGEHKRPKRPPTAPEISEDELKALKSGVYGQFSGVSIIHNEPPKAAPPNRAARRAAKRKGKE